MPVRGWRQRFGERWLRIYARPKIAQRPNFSCRFRVTARIEPAAPRCRLRGWLARLSICASGIFSRRSAASTVTGAKSSAPTAVTRGVYHDLDFIEQDVCEPIAQTGNIVLFDLLHYLSPNDQARLLSRLAPRVAPGGLLVIRDCPRDGNARFWLTHLAERFAQATTWNMKAPLHFPTREKIFAAFDEEQFSRTDRAALGAHAVQQSPLHFSPARGRSCSGRGRIQR